jgi:hypothetical protein
MLKIIPERNIGRIALGLTVFMIIFGILMPNIVGPYLGGIEAVVIMITFGAMSYALLVKSIFFEKDKSIVSWIAFGLISLVLGFWILFALGEIIFPH